MTVKRQQISARAPLGKSERESAIRGETDRSSAANGPRGEGELACDDVVDYG